MSDHRERKCWNCGSFLHHEDKCPEPRYRVVQEHDEIMRAIGHPPEGDGQEHDEIINIIMGHD